MGYPQIQQVADVEQTTPSWNHKIESAFVICHHDKTSCTFQWTALAKTIIGKLDQN
jgi:hypothetical protein